MTNRKKNTRSTMADKKPATEPPQPAAVAPVGQPEDDAPLELPDDFSKLSTNELLVKLTKQVMELRHDVGTMSSKLDHAIEDTQTLTNKVNVLEADAATQSKVIHQLKYENATLKSKNNNLQERIINIEIYTRRENLIFLGVDQKEDENCVDVIRNVIRNTMKIENVDEIKFDRCHRLPSKNLPQPLIARFNWSYDRERVWQCRKLLKNSGISIREDFPKEVVDRRNSLYPIMKRARELDRIAFLVRDKLKIGDVLYSVDNLHTLPGELDPAHLATRKHGNVVAFYSANSPLSNFYHAPFDIDGQHFPHVEQYLQYHKALVAENPKLAQKIRSTSSPVQCKRLGDSIADLPQTWIPQACDLLAKANEAKFSQNEHARNFLLQTGNATLAEATRDKLWGAGLPLKDSSLAVKNKWTGQNKFGSILMNVRSKLMTAF